MDFGDPIGRRIGHGGQERGLWEETLLHLLDERDRLVDAVGDKILDVDGESCAACGGGSGRGSYRHLLLSKYQVRLRGDGSRRQLGPKIAIGAFEPEGRQCAGPARDANPTAETREAGVKPGQGRRAKIQRTRMPAGTRGKLGVVSTKASKVIGVDDGHVMTRRCERIGVSNEPRIAGQLVWTNEGDSAHYRSVWPAAVRAIRQLLRKYQRFDSAT